ncbi:GH17547 [Drosophila grimshawi]|uniref:GH17547 n=1 Tax=Drosophila grimshawi TaxID=7222 RepID=B4JST3_DROGR|nr:GH17547 [Drosophila grimshawi]
MNTPGVSLFQGADTLKVNSTLERQEEEEALQDQKRREAELGNLLENAFDDLDDDDDDEESTIDSTTNYPSNLLPAQPLPPLPAPAPSAQQVEYVNASEMHKLKMLLESKTHELQNTNKIASDAHKKIDEYQKRLTITQAELERALREKQNMHELLVDSKEKCSNLDNNIEKLRSEKKSVEAENTQLVGQLETAQALLADVQRKYDLVERDQHRREDRNVDMRIKQLEEHHRAQTELMQQQFSQLSDQFDKKKQELDQMHMRYNSLQSSHESMLLDKAAKINELNSALDVAQHRCNQLTAQPSYEAEYTRQQICIADLHAQISSRDQTIAQLTDRLNGATAEMDLMDTLIQQHQSESGTLSHLPSYLSGSTPLNPADRMGHIKHELYRALGNLKNKREEVRRLEKQLGERTNELRTLRDEENKTLVQLATLKEDKTRLETRIKVLQEQLEDRQHNSSLNVSKMRSDLDTLITERDTLRQQLQLLQSRLDTLRQENEQLRCTCDQLTDDKRQLEMRATGDDVRLELERHKILLKDAQGEVERLKTLYTDIANEKESLNYQLRKVSDKDSVKELQEQRQQIAQLQRNVQLAELKAQELAKILETEKTRHERELQTLREKWEREKHDEVLKAAKESSSNCSKCNDQLAEITKIEIQMLKLQNTNSMQAKELDELRGELEKTEQLQLELEAKVQLAAEQAKQLGELKAKAQQYEEQLQQEAAKMTAQPSPVSSNPEVNGSPTSPELTQVRIKRIEQRVRDEMAKLFAAELKRFTMRAQQSDERSQCLQREYQVVQRDLQQRQTEVEVLKQTILAEREHMQDMLDDKDDKQKQLVQKCRNELQAKNQRIADLLRELDEQHASIESERRSMKAVMTEWDKQKQSIEQVEQHWRNHVQAVLDKHAEELQATEKRYQSAKRTVHNYKLYLEAKDAHTKSEIERIKQEYNTSLVQIEAKLHQHFHQRKSARDELPKNTNDKENEPSNH